MNDADSDLMLDSEGFLLDLTHWNETLATHIAAQEKIILNESHWEIIYLLRRFYQDFQRSPNMRALINYLKKSLDEGSERVNSIYLLQLFPSSPAKIACKIAGLPKPENCL